MIVLGLTGGIATGKSTLAAMIARMGFPVHDADATVHALFARGGRAVGPIDAAFPGVVRDGAVDRTALGRRVFGDPAALGRLETIVHPLVRVEERAFLARARRQRARLVVLNVPLLFETGGQSRCDRVMVVACPPFLQTARALARPGMDAATLARIRARQMPEPEKRRRADIVIPTGLGKAPALRRMRRAIGDLLNGVR